MSSIRVLSDSFLSTSSLRDITSHGSRTSSSAVSFVSFNERDRDLGFSKAFARALQYIGVAGFLHSTMLGYAGLT